MEIERHEVEYEPYEEEQSFLEQYGLIKKENDRAVVANPIYDKLFSSPPSLASLPTPMPRGREKKVFISYSRKDKAWLDLLLPHLGVLEHKGIECWYDEKIRPGEDWPPEIRRAIETSLVAVCLVSVNFLNSKFIRNREIPELLKRRKAGLKILPVIVEQCPWKHVPRLAEIQIKDPTPLSWSDSVGLEKKLTAIADQVVEIFDEMQTGQKRRIEPRE